MNALNRLSIRTRLYFGTVFSLVLLVVIGAMGYLALERTRTTLEVLFTHRSVRSYLPDALPEGTLETLVTAAQSAASIDC